MRGSQLQVPFLRFNFQQLLQELLRCLFVELPQSCCQLHTFVLHPRNGSQGFAVTFVAGDCSTKAVLEDGRNRGRRGGYIEAFPLL
jgi:hypothetical protein